MISVARIECAVPSTSLAKQSEGILWPSGPSLKIRNSFLLRIGGDFGSCSTSIYNWLCRIGLSLDVYAGMKTVISRMFELTAMRRDCSWTARPQALALTFSWKNLRRVRDAHFSFAIWCVRFDISHAPIARFGNRRDQVCVVGQDIAIVAG